MYNSHFYVQPMETLFEVLLGRRTIKNLNIIHFPPTKSSVLPLIQNPINSRKYLTLASLLKLSLFVSLTLFSKWYAYPIF